MTFMQIELNLYDIVAGFLFWIVYCNIRVKLKNSAQRTEEMEFSQSLCEPLFSYILCDKNKQL